MAHPHLRTRLHPIAALPLLIALGAVAAPPARAEPDRVPASGPRHPKRLPPQHPPHNPAVSGQPLPAYGLPPELPTPGHFHMVQRQAAQVWYDEPEHRGFVPPGRGRKSGVPPGQARQWRRGEPLPAGLVWYALPRSLELVLGAPPTGHRYVRVASDILLIAVGTGIVVDAMEDLAR